MQNVDTLITHSLVVTMDKDLQVIEDGAVAVSGGKISAVGATTELQQAYRAGEVLDAGKHLVMPGLINAHTHLAMTLFRGYADDLPLQPFLDKIWVAEGRFIRPETVRVGAQLAFIEMIRGGTTLAMDMYWFPEAAADAARQAGFRLMNGPVYVDFVGPDGLEIEQRAAWAREFMLAYQDDPYVIPCVLPHGTYTVSPEHLQSAQELADEFGAVFHIHASETPGEVETVVERYGKTPARHLQSLGLLNGRSVLAHGVHLSQDEIELLAESGSSVVHCPISNLKTAAGFAPVAALREAGVPVLLGTDGSATSNDLDMWKVMRFTALIHRGLNGDPTTNPAVEVVQMATSQAAQALGLGQQLGSLEAGKSADLILVDLDQPHLTPLYDVYSHLVYAAGREDVRAAMINGRWVMRSGELTGLDESAVMDQVRALVDQIKAASA